MDESAFKDPAAWTVSIAGKEARCGRLHVWFYILEDETVEVAGYNVGGLDFHAPEVCEAAWVAFLVAKLEASIERLDRAVEHWAEVEAGKAEPQVRSDKEPPED